MADMQSLKFVFLKFVFLILLSSNAIYPSKESEHVENTCHLQTLRDIYVSQDRTDVCLVDQLIKFEYWKFAERSFLLETFPLDREMRNYVREVRNAVFSIVHPLRLKSKLRLVAVSADALVNVLDIDPSSSTESSFVEFAAGNRLVLSATPLSHRYGGHQV